MPFPVVGFSFSKDRVAWWFGTWQAWKLMPQAQMHQALGCCPSRRVSLPHLNAGNQLRETGVVLRPQGLPRPVHFQSHVERAVLHLEEGQGMVGALVAVLLTSEWPQS